VRSTDSSGMNSLSNSLTSMTGFARTTGQWRDVTWVWELKSVNGKALDLRFRMPAGFDAVEATARTAATAAMKRGNVQISLTVQSSAPEGDLTINAALLEKLVAAAEDLRDRLGSAPIQAETLLSLRGVLESGEHVLSEADTKLRDAEIVASFEIAVRALAQSRQAEGERLSGVVKSQLVRIADLTEAARLNPARSVDAIRLRLSDQVARLIEQSDAFDPQRLHQEAILLATRADIQEELDRLNSHVSAANALIASNEPVGRKFDFLAQEFNREANTLCSKANDASLTAIGLDLKTVIDQLREQVQNIE
jgi:uncharacterized protein (TIGR00255 family)